jgi:Bacterial Ig domain
MKSRIVYALAAVCLFARPAAAQFTVTQPSGTVTVKSAEDFPTRAFQDPWDMSQRTDVGWWTWGSDGTLGGQFVNPSVANGVFTGSTSSSSGGLFLLDTPLPPSLPGGTPTPIGKTGQQYPLDTTKYSHLVYRMNSTIGGVSQYTWSTKSWAEDMTLAFENAQSTTIVQPGWKIYDVDLTTLNTSGVIGGAVGWTGKKEAFQIIPLAGSTTATIQIDWVRLVGNDNTLKQNITWTGGAADIYLDSDNNPANGTLGRIAVNATSPYSFFVGALPAGTYYIAVHAHTSAETPGSAGGFFYSTGSYQVNDMPTIQFTTPSAEGSSADFATTKLGDPWDFQQMSDIDSTLPGFSGKVNVFNDGITQIPLTTEAGVSLGPQTVYLGTSVAAGPGAANPSDPVGDPQVFPLFWDGKGKANKIDPTKYRILTVEAGIPNKARSLPTGSVGRVIWRAFNEPVLDGTGTKAQTVGDQYAFNSAAGENTVMKFSIDMNKYPVEPHSADINTTWNSATASGGIDGFRFDPHEFSPATNFFIRRIKLAALEKTQGDQFTFQWTSSKTATVSIFYDLDPSHSFAGTPACQVVNAPAGPGSCTWNAAGVPGGEYQVYATINDGTNLNEVYALTNVIVDHSNTTQAVNLDKTTLHYAQIGSVHTDPQVVRVTTSGPGTIPCWTATPNALGLLSISPTSGCGAANISIGVSGFFPAGATTTLFVTIAPMGSGDWTSQNIAVNVTGLTSSSGPTGSIDTPADGTIVTGSVAVTGWAIDDVEVTAVGICRDPVGGEGTTPQFCAGQQQVFIGNATFVEGARTDIQAADPTLPFSYRAGWGYLLLSNFLPNQGNGTFRLSAYASDIDGHITLLGSKTVNGDNVHATKPFGAIDRPLQGETVCGTFINSGWALTQMPKDVPADSSTITLFIDNVAVKNLDPGRIARSDVTSLFSPTYDTSHAAGGTAIDTTQLTNGVHTIFWVVTDTGGQTDGIGSRFFTVSNPCSGS